MSEIRTVKATCLCGSAKHEISLPSSDFPLKASICHCTSCRRMTGTLCFTDALLPKQYEPSPALLDKLQAFQFSERCTQYFCPQCGTHMVSRFLDDARNPDGSVSWHAQTGTLEQADGVFEVQRHIFIGDTIDGGFSDFLTTINDKPIKRWLHEADKGEQLPLHWQSPAEPEPQPSASVKLHAQCKCGGVELWIARPSERSYLGTADWPDVIIPFNSDKPKPPKEPWWIRDGGKKYLAGVCYCDSCRLASGMEWVEWAFVPTIDITLDAEGKIPFSHNAGTLKPYQSSKEVTRYFCGTCGAIVFWNGDERPQVIDVAVGLLDAPEGARAESWLEWRTLRLSYREDAIPRAESLTLAVEAGLTDYARKYQGGQVE